MQEKNIVEKLFPRILGANKELASFNNQIDRYDHTHRLL